MSWLRRAYTISTPDPSAYYIAVDPGEFYEWRYTGVIPKGTVFTKRLPPSEIFTEGFVVASSVLPESSFETKKLGIELKRDIRATINLEVGQIQSPQELLSKYSELKKKFEVAISNFIKAAETRMYFQSLSDKPHLYKVTVADESTVELQSYGRIEDILSHFYAVRVALDKKTIKREGRAFEMEDARRFENAMTTIENKNYPIDKASIETLIRIAKLKPQQTRSVSWSKCCVELSPDVRDMQKLLDRYQSLSWIRDSIRFS